MNGRMYMSLVHRTCQVFLALFLSTEVAFAVTLLGPFDVDRANDCDHIVVAKFVSVNSVTNQVSDLNVVTNYEAFITLDVTKILKGRMTTGLQKVRLSRSLVWFVPNAKENRTTIFWAGSSPIDDEVSNVSSNCLWFLTSSRSSFVMDDPVLYPTIASPFCVKPAGEELYWTKVVESIKTDPPTVKPLTDRNYNVWFNDRIERELQLRKQFLENQLDSSKTSTTTNQPVLRAD
jgi:hypothetical protein